MNRYTTGRKAYIHHRSSRARKANNLKGLIALMRFTYITLLIFGIIMMTPTAIKVAQALIWG